MRKSKIPDHLECKAMNVNRGIFDSLPLSEQNGAIDPFSFVGEAPHESNLVTAPFFIAPTHQAQPIQLPAAPTQHNHFSVHREPVVAMSVAPMPQQSFGSWPQTQELTAAASFAKELAQSDVSPFAFEPTNAEVAPLIGVEEAPVLRQLELRAIFGVDREMSTDEILICTRSLPGIKHVAKIGYNDVASLESFKATLQGHGFGCGNIRLYFDSMPIEFVRDGQTVLAVQTNGGFAPGVKEAIMIVARELEKMT
jgi:hypothetical protein